MAGENDGRDDEIGALMDIEGIDTAKITDQVNKRKGVKTEPPKVPDVKTPDVTPPADIKTPDDKKNVPDPEAIVSGRLKEIFGDRFTNVDELKKANIPAQLQELETLRQKTQSLETQLQTKPKHHYANDDIAKFDEFVRSTGIKDAGVFNKLNVTDVTNMDNMDALVLQHIVDNPSLAGKEPQVRRYFEMKFNVDPNKIDPKKVESGDLTQEELEQNKLEYETNLIGVASEGGKAKSKLQELKSKIKMPEIPADDTDKKVKWTPEIEVKQKADWTKVNEKMGEEFKTIPIRMKGSDAPIVNFVLPEETKKVILTNALDYAVSNQMEINEANVTSVATQMYSEAILSNMSEIAHAIFERARSMTEDEYLKTYHNPSPKSTDKPPAGEEPESEEAKKEKAYQAELNR